MDRRVVKAVSAEALDVRLADLRGVAGQLDRVVEERSIGVGELAHHVVVFDRIGEPWTLFFVDLSTEVVAMGAGSISAGIGTGDRDRDHLPLITAQRTRAVHQLRVELDRGI